MRTTFSVAVGTDLIGATLPDGTGATGIIIDNPSGYWLQIYPDGGTCPPYTQGYAVNFETVAPSIDVRPMIVGPASQVVTAAGDPVTVTLYSEDEAPSASQGAPFIAGFTPSTPITLGITGVIAVPSGPQTDTLISCPAGHRIRLLSVNAAIDSGVYPATDYSSGAHLWFLDDEVNLPLVQLAFRAGQPAVVPFSGGLDVTKGGNVSIRYWSDWADVGIVGTVVYQVI